MSYVTAHPEALDFAAGKLEGIGTSLATENAAAAASTASVSPAAADEVSALQATQFTAYGHLYQQVSAQATAIHQAFVQMLGTSANSYSDTESANSAATGTSGLGGFSLSGQLTQFGQFGAVPGALSNLGLTGLLQGNMFGSAASSFFSMMPLASGGAGTVAAVGPGELTPVGSAQPAGAAPVLASMSRAATVGGLSVPPNWAEGAVPAAVKAAPVWASTAAPHSVSVSTVPGGIPSIASGGKTSGLGRPRYGMRPRVMPKPSVV